MMKKPSLPQCPPGTPPSLATSVGDLYFRRAGNGEIIPHPTEEDPIRIGFVGDRPAFTSVDYYVPEMPTLFDVDGNSPDSRPIEFDSDGLSVAPEIAKGCFQRDGDDLLMIDTAIVERTYPNRGFRIAAVGKSEDDWPVACGISAQVSDKPKIDSVSINEPEQRKERYYFVSCVLTSADKTTRGDYNAVISVLDGGLTAIREGLLGLADWAETVWIVSLTPLSKEEYEFLKS